MKRLGQSNNRIVIFLIQFLFYGILWLGNNYLAVLLSAIFAGIAAFVLLISLITEWIEPSKVPGWYYSLMIISFLAPAAAALVFGLLLGSDLEWDL